MTFEIGDNVLARDYSKDKRILWKEGKIKGKIGSKMYFVEIFDKNTIWKRHINQLIKGSNVSDQDEVIPQGNSFKIVDKKFGITINSDVEPTPAVTNVIQQVSDPNLAGTSQSFVRRSERVIKQPDRLNYK